MRPPAFALVMLLGVTTQASAWAPDGVVVSRTPNEQGQTLVASDGAGGVFISWVEVAGAPIPEGDLYLQHLTGAGTVAPGWPSGGQLVATGPRYQVAQSLVPDGSGGVFIGIGDGSADEGDVYLQRVPAGGQTAPGWPQGGVPIGVRPSEQSDIVVAQDGRGGAWVAWHDYGVRWSWGRLNHILDDGSIAPGWPPDGRLHEPSYRIVPRPLLLGDGAGGFFACWRATDDTVSQRSRILGQHYFADASPDSAWPVGGAVLCIDRPGNRGPWQRIVPDGGGGFYAVWEDFRATPPLGSLEYDLYAQHVRADGTLPPGWPEDGRVVCALQGSYQNNPRLCEDGLGGLFVSWTDGRGGFPQVYVQHLGAGGERMPGWPENGRLLSTLPGFHLNRNIESDGVGGAYVVWMNLEARGYRTRVLRLQSNGEPAPGWSAEGVEVSTTFGDTYEPAAVADGLGGVLVAWEDGRNYVETATDIYAQRFVPDGPVAVTVSLVSADASPTDVRLHWRVIGEVAATVERRVADGAWQPLARITADGEGNLRHTDADVTPGERYAYRLAFASGERGGETSVTVPVSLQLALEGARPNPTRRAPAIAFTLPAPGPARLELLDVSGRRVASRELASLGVGHHVLRVDDAPLSPGLYWAVLTHAGRTLRAKVAIVE